MPIFNLTKLNCLSMRGQCSGFTVSKQVYLTCVASM